MLRLLTFGGLALEPNGSAVPRVRPPRLALLATLAAAGDRGVTRERMVGIFWPEADEEHGRHSLRQALYALKNEAGLDLVHSGPTLVLNNAAVTSDIEDFRGAIERRDRRKAAALYRGPFLDGFYLSGAVEFERWVDQERTRLAEAVHSALLDLAVEASVAKCHDDAVRWWQQLTLLEPLSGRFALGYARALLATGDRPQALAAIRAHEMLVRRELEVEPDAELRRLELEIRNPVTASLPPPVVADPAPGPPASTAPDPVPQSPERVIRRRWLRRTGAGVVSLVVLLGSRQVLSRPAEPVVSVLDRPFTRSVVAARFYEEGLQAFRIRDLPASRRLMQAALREDSSFAMAAYIASKTVQQPDNGMRERALRLAANAPERERLTILADLLGALQDPAALSVAEDAAVKYPTEPGIQLALGRARWTAGQWAGAAAAFERALTLSPPEDPRHPEQCGACEALGGLTETYWWWDSLPAVARTARRHLEMYPADGWPWALLAQVSARNGDSTTAMLHLRRHEASGPNSLPPDQSLTILLTLENYEGVAELAQPLLGSSREDESNQGRWNLFIALRNQGRLRDAELLLRTGRIGTSTPIPAVPLRVEHLHEALISLESGNPRRAAAFFDLLRAMPTHHAPGQVARWRAWNTLLMATALAAAGDTTAVRQLVDTVQYWGERTLFGRDRKSHHFLRGLLLAAEGRDQEAVTAYRAAVVSWSFGYTRVNYELARALLRLGRPAEAVAALQPALRGSTDASNLYITRTELHELLAEAFDQAGQPDSAAAHYQAVVKAWQRADDRFLPRRLAAATRLEYLTRNPSTRGPTRIVRR